MKWSTYCKVQLFWEGHKILRNQPHGFDIYLVNVKTMRQIAQTFSEKLNFKVEFIQRYRRRNNQNFAIPISIDIFIKLYQSVCVY